MREIKFRQYLFEEKKMLSWEDLLNEEEESLKNCFTHKFSNASELMQYTGLKDKNGKEIYEGDIVSFDDTGEEGYEYKEGYDFTNHATVVFENSRWELDNFADDNSSVLDDMEHCHEDFIEIFKYAEVIGNIWEDGDLLDSK